MRPAKVSRREKRRGRMQMYYRFISSDDIREIDAPT